MGNQDEMVEGPFKVTEGIEPKKASAEEGFPIWIIILIVIIIIMVLIIFFILQTHNGADT